jgi:hypothetical protein
MTTKKQARVRTQDARRRAAELRRQEASKERRRKVLVRAGVVLAVLAAGGGIAAAAVLGGGGGGGTDKVKTFTYATRNHVTGTVKYAQNPPAGGDHNAVWLNCGIYDSPVPNENAVHDLEHGAVWITYRPSLSAADVATLKALVTSKTKGYLDLSPYPGLPAPVVASGWGVQVKLTGANDPELAKFVDKYQLGPQAPELGSSCSGGTGTPTG